MGIVIGMQHGNVKDDHLALDKIKGMINGLRAENVHGINITVLTKSSLSEDLVECTTHKQSAAVRCSVSWRNTPSQSWKRNATKNAALAQVAS